MHRLIQCSKKHPFFFSIIVSILSVAVTEISLKNLFSPLLGDVYADYLPGMHIQFLTALVLAILAKRIELPGLEAYTPPRSLKAWILGWPLFALSVVLWIDLNYTLIERIQG